jgi:hypothetical protein
MTPRGGRLNPLAFFFRTQHQEAMTATMAASASDNDDVAEIMTSNSAANSSSSSSHSSKQEKGEEQDEFAIIVKTIFNRRLAQESLFPVNLHFTSFNK